MRKVNQKMLDIQKISDPKQKIEAMMDYIGFLEFRISRLDQLHEEVVQRKWKNDMTRQNYTCLYPFERIEVCTQGRVYTCCSSYLKPDFLIGNIFYDDIDQIWNSDSAKKLRYSVLKGDFEYCHEHCRLWHNRKGSPYPLVKRPICDYEDYRQCEVKKGPTYITLACDQTCNLYCKSCRKSKIVLAPEESKKLEQMLEQKIRPLLRDCKYLSMLGSGEVFASPACSNFLKSITAEEFPNLSILLDTNGQLLTPSRWMEYQNLRGLPISFTVSIDAAEKDTYESIRCGGKWDILYDNMVFLGELKKKLEVQYIQLNFVVQKENYKQMAAFVELGKKWNADAILFTRINNWGTYSRDEYQQLNIFDSANPCRQEAQDILYNIVQTTKGIKILENILPKDQVLLGE